MRRLLPMLVFALFCANLLLSVQVIAQDAAPVQQPAPGAPATPAQPPAPPATSTQPASPAAPQAPAPQPPANQQGAPTAPNAQSTAPAPAPEPATDEAPPAKVAPPPSIEELITPIETLSDSLDAAEKNLERSPGTQRDLSTLRAGIEKIEANAKSSAAKLQPRLEEVRSQIEKLGPPPAADAPPESAEVAAERQRLNAIAAEIDGAIKKAALIEVRSRQLVSRVQEARQGIFTRFLFRQTDTPLQLRVWRQGGEQLHLAQRQIGFILSNWWSAAKLNIPALLSILGAAVLAYVGLRYFRRRILLGQLDSAGDPNPTLPQRALRAAWVAPALALPPLVAFLITYVGLDEMGLLYWQVERFAQATVYPVIVAVSVIALSHAVLQPGRPRWRIFDLDDASARTINLAVRGIAIVFAADYIIRRVVMILSLPLSTSIIIAFFASLLYAVFLLYVVRTPLRPYTSAPDARVSRWYPLWLKLLLVALAVFLVAVSLLGYVALGRFITSQLLTTGAGLVATGVLYIAVRGLMPDPVSTAEEGGISGLIQKQFKLGEFGSSLVPKLLRACLYLVLFAIAAPLLLMSLGMTYAEIMSWVRAAIFGFDVGGVRVSLARILMALLLFITVLTVTRFVQRWLASGALARGRIEPGLANSIYTGAGYVGFAVATLAAIAYAGFDITSLAIVAGALSVGIGFGLQSIVNNFVSGLILLVERPIKVGDRVTVNGELGFVRRISVRATEIETLDRSTLIVPNAEFITTTVTNWTHRNALGRVLVRVSAGYDADPEKVLEILLNAASESEFVLKHPPPWAGLVEFGPDGLNFIVVGVLRDVNTVGDAGTDVRIRVLKGFRAAGLSIPYPQREFSVSASSVRDLMGYAKETREREEEILSEVSARETPRGNS
jgi:small-conductance mechanosensitive channel